jgi:hypothetical protein
LIGSSRFGVEVATAIATQPLQIGQTMSLDIKKVHEDLLTRARAYAILVGSTKLKTEVAGKFDGRTITLNQQYDPAEQCFYLAHAIGTIAEWSLHRSDCDAIFRELKTSKRQQTTNPDRLTRAVAVYVDFETKTWGRARWLVEDTGHRDVVKPLTNFGRADLEAMQIFHMTGKAPVWSDFYAQWNAEVERGARTVAPFASRPIPPFEPIRIPTQEILQEEDEA